MVNALTPECWAALLLLDRPGAIVVATTVPALRRDLFRFAAEALRSGSSAVSGHHLLEPEPVLPGSV